MTKREKSANGKSKYAIKRENAWNKISKAEEETVNNLSKDYLNFLSNAKTERLAHDIAIKMAEDKGYKNIDDFKSEKGALKPGDKIYRSFMGRTLMLFQIGTKNIEDGLHIIGGHIDAPRLDLKPNPLYEDGEMALFDTHYYGGIKKYQWVTLPLAMHGVVAKEDGTLVSIKIGEDPADSVFTITDLLPHLAKDQAKKSLAVGINGEGLNVLIAGKPLQGAEVKEKVKEAILDYLNKKYGIIEEDLTSADIQFVPAGPARELGIDRSMIMGYGQDDRICAFTALRALLDIEDIPEYTSAVLLCDKEEIGSHGATGMDSTFFENSIAEVLIRLEENYHDLLLRRVLEKSRMISADVTGAHDPNFPDASAPNNNMAQLNYGPVFSKYTGSRGKYGASEASAEFMGKIRQIYNDAKVCWQSSELGKVDAGGGGTIAHFMARYGMNVVDCGPALLSMHSPWEVSSKVDIYYTWKGYKAFLECKN